VVELSTSLRSSQSIPVTFTFEEAGYVTVVVMVSEEEQNPSSVFVFPSDEQDQDPTD